MDQIECSLEEVRRQVGVAVRFWGRFQRPVEVGCAEVRGDFAAAASNPGFARGKTSGNSISQWNGTSDGSALRHFSRVADLPPQIGGALQLRVRLNRLEAALEARRVPLRQPCQRVAVAQRVVEGCASSASRLIVVGAPPR